jgi:hypothetical protein
MIGSDRKNFPFIFSTNLEIAKMPKTFGGLIGFVLTALVTVAVGLWIINRVAVLSDIVYGRKAA